VATGVAYSVAKLDLSGKIQGGGATTDSGGGGTKESVGKPLITLGILQAIALIANCMIHNFNLEMAVPLNKVLIGMKVDKDVTKKKHDEYNVEQLIFSCFSWEHEVGRDTVSQRWNAMAEHVDNLLEGQEVSEEYQDGQVMVVHNPKRNKTFIGMKQGCETQWWTLGEAACILYDTLPVQVNMARNFNKLKKNGKVRETCQTFLLLVKEQTIITHSNW
jgi:hypothetical protein